MTAKIGQNPLGLYKRVVSSKIQLPNPKIQKREPPRRH